MRRVYPSWFPPNPRERRELLKIRRMQKTVVAWMIGFMPAGWIVILVTHSSDFMVPLTVLWIGIGVWMARHVTACPCPRCAEKFCENPGLPYWYALFSRHCESCGLSLTSAPTSDD